MANTYCRVLLHLIWSTKNREPLLSPEIATRMWAYLHGIGTANGMNVLCIGGVADHVHVLMDLPKTLSPAEAVQRLKGGSAHWLNEEKLLPVHFAWQDGYACFSVSPSRLDEVAEYIENQREHHRKVSFAEEYRHFLERHGVEFDERFLLG